MKKLFSIIGIVFLSIVILLNICFTAFLDASEHITINNNKINNELTTFENKKVRKIEYNGE